MAGQETGLIGMEMEMTEKRKIPVVIPAYEPDEKLLGLLGELKKEGIAPVIVVDDGSGPKYRKLFDRAEKEFGAKVLRHAVNLGKGRALKTAFNECLQSSGEIIGCVTADSDGQHTAASIRKCMEAMREHPLALVLGSGLGVAGSVHVRFALHLGHPQGVDNDMDMDVAAVVVTVRVGADQGLVSGELLGTEPLPQRLGLVHCQAVVGAVPGVKGQDVVMAFHVLPLLVFSIAEIGPHTGYGEVLLAAIQRRNAVVLTGDKPPVLVQDGLAGELVMLKGEVLLRHAVVGIFRA